LVRQQKRHPWWSMSFTALAVVCAFIAFFLALLLPAIESARYALKHPDSGESLSAESAGRSPHVEGAGSSGPDLYRSVCLGASVFVVMMTGGYMVRRLRNRERRQRICR
jgi:hypothetical protein